MMDEEPDMTTQTELLDDRPAEDVDFTDPSFLAAPWQPLLKLGDRNPVFWSDLQQAWIVTRHADVKAGYSDARLSAERAEIYLRTAPPNAELICPTAIRIAKLHVGFLDGPDHMRIRTLMMKAFTRSVVESFRAHTVATIEELLAAAPKGEPFDLVGTITSRLPARVLQRILGVSVEEAEEFFEHAQSIVEVLASVRPNVEDLERFESATIRLNQMFEALMLERERLPTDDLLSHYVNARDNLERLSHDETLAACHQTIVAGTETTAHFLAVGLAEIARSKDLTSLIRSEPGAEKRIVDELLRYPSLVKGLIRIARVDFEWHGQAIKAGDVLFLMNISANTDPEIFEDPFTINPNRDCRSSLSFAPGFHHCIGHLLARMELEEFYSRVLNAYDLTILENDPKFVDNFVFRGYKRLMIQLDPRTQL
ncbi:cytochrome P450 [Novosphingobium colocasiae]|nr:cytochrome P450 [Novosphingobium colocasiae]